MSFVGELKRRNVIRVALLYFVSAWLLLQLTDVLSSLLPVPEWTGSLVFLLLLIGLPPALVFAWVYEMTPEGLKREKDVDRSHSITTQTGKKINVVITVLLVLAIAGMVVDRLIPEKAAPPQVVEQVGQATAVRGNSIAVLRVWLIVLKSGVTHGSVTSNTFGALHDMQTCASSSNRRAGASSPKW